MKCKCKYFLMKDGIRVCSVCGKPAKVPFEPIEDKVVEKHETKAVNDG